MLLVVWCCKKNQKLETRLPACVTIADPENPNKLHTRVGAIGTDKCSVLGWETVEIQDQVGTQHTVLRNDMQDAFTSVLLDQLEEYGTNVKEHHRRLRDRLQAARTPIEANPPTEIHAV